MGIKLFLLKITLFLVTFFLVYLGVSFVKLTFYFSLWNEETRFIMLMLGSLLGILNAISLNDNNKLLIE